ncbi:hypothetical protein [Mucilaginibacter polytrichastri]|uniref:HNH endonuclease n=1 Tax=Mucilaginibacter polytrichastri TaxID=1302689 RepID=A0A1Q6A267_9SPHI|nr:hypothetical protein [Mucilaginibacter polytrichastri]OKS88103.1 hypothetical protein RG47T_3567 [Mucilaginibacter polytrichastri]
MAKSRDEFSKSTKLKLAQRVAYQCSSPGCTNITIGPHQSDPNKVMNLGQAAHIHAAAVGGPRYLGSMTPEERSSPDNGIWLCNMHARAVDLDAATYTDALLKVWKKAAEDKAARALLNAEREIETGMETLIVLDVDLMFTGEWIGARGDQWTFVVKDFLFGNVERLRNFGKNELLPRRRYLIIESQNEGRLLQEGCDWHVNAKGQHEITVRVYPEISRISLKELGSDIASAYDGDLLIADGDFQKVSGAQHAKQVIERNLGLPFGSWIFKPMMGSYFPMYYAAYQDNLPMLNRLTRMELIRLMTIPTSLLETEKDAPLNFVKSITEVSVMAPLKGLAGIFISLLWSDGTAWSDTLYVNYKQDDTEPDEEDQEIIALLRQTFEQPPLALLQKAASVFKGEELKLKRDNTVIQRLFNETLPTIVAIAQPAMQEEIYPLFDSYETSSSIDRRAFGFYTTADIELAVTKGNVAEIGLHIILRGFKKAGVDAFDVYGDLYIFFDDYYFAVKPSHHGPVWHKKLYDVEITSEDIRAIAAQWVEHLATLTTRQINALK